MAFTEWYRCPCGRYRFKITRGKHNTKPKGHLKRLWCPLCMAARDFVKV